MIALELPMPEYQCSMCMARNSKNVPVANARARPATGSIFSPPCESPRNSRRINAQFPRRDGRLRAASADTFDRTAPSNGTTRPTETLIRPSARILIGGPTSDRSTAGNDGVP